MARICARPPHRRFYPLLLLATILVVFCCWYRITLHAYTPNPLPQSLINRRVNITSDSKQNSKGTNGTTYQNKKVTSVKESFLEKLEYHLIKGVMQSLITSHNNQRNKLTSLMNSSRKGDAILITAVVSNNEETATSDSLHSVSPPNATPTNATQLSSTRPKKILLYTNFFGLRKKWKTLLGNSTDLLTCPERRCVFSSRGTEANTADALVFHAFDFHPARVPKVRLPHQQYIWMTHEAPSRTYRRSRRRGSLGAGFFNWTMTYHRDSDIFLPYGGLSSLLGESGQARPILNRSGVTYRKYMKAQQAEGQPEASFDFEPGGSDWSSFLARPKLLSWMVSHCTTVSGRELYVRELQKYVEVDVYGRCGNLTCGRSHQDTYCYQKVLRPTYKFYLAFENIMCEDYMTEKVWYPLHYGLVPVVYGGARYDHFLPPHSYVDATSLTPRQLAHLLTSVGRSPRRYARYHLWRKYWRVLMHPPLCELCRLLHRPPALANTTAPTRVPSVAAAPEAWWDAVNNCTTRYPVSQYPRTDMVALFRDLAQNGKVLGGRLGLFLTG